MRILWRPEGRRRRMEIKVRWGEWLMMVPGRCRRVPESLLVGVGVGEGDAGEGGRMEVERRGRGRVEENSERERWVEVDDRDEVIMVVWGVGEVVEVGVEGGGGGGRWEVLGDGGSILERK